MPPSRITLSTPPFPSAFVEQNAIIKCLAFSGDPVDRWCTINPVVFASGDDIPPEYLHQQMRHDALEELRPDSVVVTALLDDEVAGVAVWEPPRRYRRPEGLLQFLYRIAIGCKVSIIEWCFPVHWDRPNRRALLNRLRIENAERNLGKGNLSQTWYLKTLAVHPKLQRRGVGSELVKWGLVKAQSGGERVYLDASPSGERLYTKMGFKEMGSFTAGSDGEIKVMSMVWDPSR